MAFRWCPATDSDSCHDVSVAPYRRPPACTNRAPVTPAPRRRRGGIVTALPQTTEVVDPVPGAGAPHLPQQPDLVPLLTPEGERVEDPDYPLDISDEELRGLYR